MPFISPTDAQLKSFDYVVIGGGTAGLTVAARLVEQSSCTVLVIEAGGYHSKNPLVNVPGYISRSIGNPELDWAHKSKLQGKAGNRIMPQPRGKGLGGSSLINYLGMFRPSEEEMDALEKLGNKGWNWSSFLHYAKKCETVDQDELSIARSQSEAYAIGADTRYHGTEGPLKLSFMKSLTEIHADLFRTGEQLGIPKNKSINDRGAIGSVTPILCVDPSTATRSFAATGYLEPNLHRDNLSVLINAQVVKINLEKRGDLQYASSLDFMSEGMTYRVSGINKDVILSAGTLQTPQVLELSGIGNPAVLSQFNIDIIIDLPGVGENLQDHLGVTTMAEAVFGGETVNDLKDPVISKKHEELYAKSRTGLLATVPGVGFMFVPVRALGSEDEVMRWRSSIHPAKPQAGDISRIAPGLEKQFEVLEELFDKDDQAHGEIMNFIGNLSLKPGSKYTTLSCSLLHPLSRGSVHIASSDPLTAPIIDPNYLSNETDLEILVGVVEFALKLYTSSPLADSVKDICLPPKEAIAGGKEGLKEYVRNNCRTIYHSVGTASMLPREDGGVVDSELKVYGTSNLRVVDLSILPLEPSCHTQSLAYAIGEKAADILLRGNAVF